MSQIFSKRQMLEIPGGKELNSRIL